METELTILHVVLCLAACEGPPVSTPRSVQSVGRVLVWTPRDSCGKHLLPVSIWLRWINGSRDPFDRGTGSIRSPIACQALPVATRFVRRSLVVCRRSWSRPQGSRDKMTKDKTKIGDRLHLDKSAFHAEHREQTMTQCGLSRAGKCKEVACENHLLSSAIGLSRKLHEQNREAQRRNRNSRLLLPLPPATTVYEVRSCDRASQF